MAQPPVQVPSLSFDPEAFVERAPWTFAKTMPHIPHEYVVRGKDVPQDQFDAMVAHIAAHGRGERWGRRLHAYLELGGWKYWAMPGRGTRRVIIINRERVDAGRQG
jgi:hypothetical protein